MNAADLTLYSFLLVLGVLILDPVIGSKHVIGRVRGRLHPLQTLAHYLATRLDRKDRSEKNLIVRGLLVCALVLPALYGVGLIMDIWWQHDVQHGLFVAPVITLLILLVSCGQKSNWDRARDIMASLTAQEKQQGTSPRKGQFGSTRWVIERLTLDFSSNFVAAIALFLIGGVALLLPYLFLRALIGMGREKGPLLPTSSFYKVPSTLVDLFALPGAILAYISLACSLLLIPHRNMGVVWSLAPPAAPVFWCHYYPLKAISYGLNLAFKLDPEKDRGEANWLGPRDGRARPGAKSLGTALTVIWISTLFFGLLLGLIFVLMVLSRL